MAMSRSLLEYGNDEVRDDGITDICSYCATVGKLQPALHFCFDCGVYGRFICGICLRNHNMFLNNHDVERMAEKSKSRRIKGNDSKVRELQQSNEKLQRDKTKLKKENDELLVNIHGIKLKNEKLTKDLNECKMAFNAANERLKSKIKDFERETKNNESRYMELVKEKDNLLSRLKGDQIKSLKILNENLQKDSENLQKDKKFLEEERTETVTCEIKNENTKLSNVLDDYKVKHIDLVMAKDAHQQEHWSGLRKQYKRKSCVPMSDGTVKPKATKCVMVAIEIGNSSSGYTFTLNQKDVSKIADNSFCCQWTSRSRRHLSFKTPTVALFDVNKKFHSFGYEAEEMYAKLEEDDEHQEWYFFRRFMLTLKEEKKDLKYVMFDIKGKKMHATDVLSAVITHFKEHSLGVLKQRCNYYAEKDIQWIIPTPAIWTGTYNAIQMLREAAYKAGICDTDVTLISMPEAASFHCLYNLMDSESSKSHIPSGTKFMVIDLGDSTSDFTIFERTTDGTLYALRIASDTVECDTNLVMIEFLRLISDILSSKIYQKCIDQEPNDYLDLQRDIETKMRTIKPDHDGKVTLKVPVSFNEIFKKVRKQNINQAIKKTKHNGQIYWLPDRIRMDLELAKSMFQPYIRMIKCDIKDSLKNQDFQDTKLFLMVGVMSECLMVQEAVKEAFPNVRVIIPAEPSTAVMTGALVYGCKQLNL